MLNLPATEEVSQEERHIHRSETDHVVAAARRPDAVYAVEKRDEEHDKIEEGGDAVSISAQF